MLRSHYCTSAVEPFSYVLSRPVWSLICFGRDIATTATAAFWSPSWLNGIPIAMFSLRGRECTNIRLGSPNLRFGLANHGETSFYEQGAFHKSFIFKPPALALNKQKAGLTKARCGLASPSRTFHTGLSITKRLSCHLASCQNRSCLQMPLARYSM
jgi:hypothetical protein